MKRLAITLKRSMIGCSPKQKTTLKTLGLHKRERTIFMPDNPSIQGMLNQVSHLVEVKSVNE